MMLGPRGSRYPPPPTVLANLNPRAIFEDLLLGGWASAQLPLQRCAAGCMALAVASACAEVRGWGVCGVGCVGGAWLDGSGACGGAGCEITLPPHSFHPL